MWVTLELYHNLCLILREVVIKRMNFLVKFDKETLEEMGKQKKKIKRKLFSQILGVVAPALNLFAFIVFRVS